MIEPSDDSDTSDVEGPAGICIPIVGDVIGDTAYSERFVLRVLMKLANLEVFKRVIKLDSFDAELSKLWEMSAEKDVVHFLLEHDALNLFEFALPETNDEEGRIGEMIIGIIANMCCQKEAVTALINNQTLFQMALGNLKTNHTSAMIQSLRMVSHCLYMSDEEERHILMTLFEDVEYTTAMCFILKNSSNKNLLINMLENFNTLCEYLNIEPLRKQFHKHFVKPEVLESVATAFNEIMIMQRKLKQGDSNMDSLERVLAITLQIGLNLVWFDLTSPQMYNDNIWSVVTMLSQILAYYEHKVVSYKNFDIDLEYIFQAANMVLTTLDVSHIANPNIFFFPGYRIWKALTPKKNKYGQPLSDEIVKQVDRYLQHINEFLSIYMSQCTKENFVSVIDVIGRDYMDIVGGTDKSELKKLINTRIKDTKENRG